MSDKVKYQFIMMSCGYVESNMTSWLLYGCQFFGRDGFDTLEEAIKELALDLYAKFYDDHISVYENRYTLDFSKCCRDVLIPDKDANFCKTCGKKIANKKFDPQEFRDYVTDLHNTTCDSYGDAEDTSTRALAWWPYSIREFMQADRKSVVLIAESAEHIILEALYEVKPELMKEAEGDDYQNYASTDWADFKAGKQPSYS